MTNVTNKYIVRQKVTSRREHTTGLGPALPLEQVAGYEKAFDELDWIPIPPFFSMPSAALTPSVSASRQPLVDDDDDDDVDDYYCADLLGASIRYTLSIHYSFMYLEYYQLIMTVYLFFIIQLVL